MKLLTAVVLAPLCVVHLGAEELRGRLVVGNETYAVEGSIWRDKELLLHLTLELTQNGVLRSLTAVFNPKGGDLYIDGEPQRLSADLAVRWAAQLETGFAQTLNRRDWDCRETAAQMVCDSRTIVPVSHSLAGRMRLVYTTRRSVHRLLVSGNWRLSQLRLFSLAEWLNPFGEYVSLSLEFQ